MIEWQEISKAPSSQPVLVTSEHFPGWFDIGAETLGEWRCGYAIAGDLMAHHPTHFAMLNPVEKRRMS